MSRNKREFLEEGSDESHEYALQRTTSNRLASSSSEFAILYKGKLLRGPIFAVFVDNRLITKIKLAKYVQSIMGMSVHVQTCKMIKIAYPRKFHVKLGIGPGIGVRLWI